MITFRESRKQAVNFMNKNILLVEDDERMKEIVTDYFSKEDFRIIEAVNGREALELFELEVIDLVLLDIMIPRWLVRLQ
jgi:DNA-binding response OmpR family regulator